MSLTNFAAFILTHGRPDNVRTYKSLRKHGYTGKIYLVVDNLDKTQNEYKKKFGDEVIIFDKVEISKTFDLADNFDGHKSIVFARNASFEIAKDLNLKYFIQLDDDYNSFDWRHTLKGYIPATQGIKNLDLVFQATIDFFETTKVNSIAFLQGGDFIGGSENQHAKEIALYRKAMNSFICSTERPFKFHGRINEDVNTYTAQQMNGNVFLLSIPHYSLCQEQTQQSSGGMTETYLDSGTYVKSFYSVMMAPSAVKVRMMGVHNPRLHHSVSWKHCVPQIISDDWKRKK